jgi:hypothetical protein
MLRLIESSVIDLVRRLPSCSCSRSCWITRPSAQIRGIEHGSSLIVTQRTFLRESLFVIHSPGPGTKGQRYYDWVLITLTAQAGHHWLLIHRHTQSWSESLRRWTVEDSLQAAKDLAGLNDHQLRRWPPWRRWTLLAMRRHAVLAAIGASQRARHLQQLGLIALTCLPQDPTPVHQADHRIHPSARRHAGLLTLATLPSTPCPRLSLPSTTSPTHGITI